MKSERFITFKEINYQPNLKVFSELEKDESLCISDLIEGKGKWNTYDIKSICLKKIKEWKTQFLDCSYNSCSSIIREINHISFPCLLKLYISTN